MTFPQKHDCTNELHDADLKVTPARIGILSALETTKLPLDISDLVRYLSDHKIQADRVTVFRSMNVLSEKGLVKQIQFNEGKLRYEYAAKPDHHHFVCEKCGMVEDISQCNVEKIEKDLQKTKGLLIRHHSLEFFGLCAKCQQ
ncbi:MAG TPA: Fur family transcriptional regulator [Patescibacteria group bacterium]|nr:Fur family transcriptional regulator [Patescibacteria group bacterium]